MDHALINWVLVHYLFTYVIAPSKVPPRRPSPDSKLAHASAGNALDSPVNYESLTIYATVNVCKHANVTPICYIKVIILVFHCLRLDN